MLKLSATLSKDIRRSKIAGAPAAIKKTVPSTLTRIAIDAEKLLKTDYLQRGGAFRRTKAQGWKWVRNPSVWLRVGDGTLRRSWLHIPASVVSGGWQASIVSRGVPYARIHEYGGRAGRGGKTILRKRSYLAPMIADHKPKWVQWVGFDLMAIFK